MTLLKAIHMNLICLNLDISFSWYLPTIWQVTSNKICKRQCKKKKKLDRYRWMVNYVMGSRQGQEGGKSL